MTSREKILRKIKATREAKNQTITPVICPEASGLTVPESDLAMAFKNSLELVNGECYIADNENDCLSMVNDFINENNDKSNIILSSSLSDTPFASLQTSDIEDISKIDIGITTCELLSAQTGTAIVTSQEGRKIIGLSPIHIIIAKRIQLRATLDECVKELALKYGNNYPSQLTLITGPSRTADIEKTLILGAHGPKKLAVFII